MLSSNETITTGSPAQKEFQNRAKEYNMRVMGDNPPTAMATRHGGIAFARR